MEITPIGLGKQLIKALLSRKKFAVRGFDFPDGVHRRIKLSHWHWEALDWLKSEKGWTDDDIVESAYELSVEEWEPLLRTFEEEIIDSMRLMITQSISAYNEEERGKTNDNNIFCDD